MLSALQPYLPLELVIMMYNIMCQYVIRLGIRMDEEFTPALLEELISISSKDLPEIIAGVGKYHLSMHTKECRHRFSLNLLPCACMDDGETCERLWGLINAVSRATKEMGAGHRHDVLNDVINDLNIKHLHNMGTRDVLSPTLAD